MSAYERQKEGAVPRPIQNCPRTCPTGLRQAECEEERLQGSAARGPSQKAPAWKREGRQSPCST